MISTVVAALARLFAGSTVAWVAEPECDRQRIYIANHTSHLDFILLWANLPAHCRAMTRPVAARDYWERGRLRRYLASHVFHALLIDRAATPGDRAADVGRRAVDAMTDAMGMAYSLILFPEGTRGSGDEMAPFRTGLYFLCKARPDVAVVPVYLENLNRILPKGGVIPIPLLSHITYGEPIVLGEAEEKQAFLERAQHAIGELAAR